MELALRFKAKESLRGQMKRLRRALPSDARKARSTAVITRMNADARLDNARSILSYSPVWGEVDLRPWTAARVSAGARLALPRVDFESGSLHLHWIEDGLELTEGAYGIMEPPADAPRCATADIDLVFVPGLAFDERGFRVGYGAGYYDRLLPTLTRARRYAVAYDFQLVLEVPETDGDQPMQVIVTDQRVIECPVAF